jgi:pimeloyl-ACP methyl ester carboxylesterase
MSANAAPRPLVELVDRYDPSVFHPGRGTARLRLEGAGPRSADVLLDAGSARLIPSEPDQRADAVLSADPATWKRIAGDLRGGMSAFRSGRLRVRRNLHLGVGFLAATAGATEPGRLRFRRVRTARGAVSMMEAGAGPPVLLLHGLGATKASLLPTLAALAPSHHAIAVDLPGFGDSDKPVRARYDPPFFAAAMTALLDTLELARADVVGNSLGGRVAIELGLRDAGRVGRLALLAPSLAWLRDRPWAAPLRWVPPQLGLLQPTPRALVETIMRRLVPGAEQEWAAVGIDEFLRAYLDPRGRAAFYAAARNIYLEEPYGPEGFWTRLPELRSDSLFVWGRRDGLVPIRFARHVRRVLPAARHLELDCGHVPQLERPRETHDALLGFLAGDSVG